MRRASVTAILSLTAAGVTIAFVPNETRVIVQLELEVVGVITVLVALGALRRAAPLAPPSPLDRTAKPSAPTPRPLPLDLVRISRRLAAAEASAADTRRHLGPLVAAIAADRLQQRAHRSIEPESVFADLPRPVPPPLALVLDPALAGLDTRQMPGLDAAGSEALVQALEQL